MTPARQPQDCAYLLRRGMSVLCIDSTDPPRKNCEHVICPSCFGSAPVKFPNSTELLLMAHTDWKNRIERKHTHEEIPWVDGWIHGFLTPRQEYIRSRPHTPAPMPQDPCYVECDDCQRHECNMAGECLASDPKKVERKENYNATHTSPPAPCNIMT